MLLDCGAAVTKGGKPRSRSVAVAHCDDMRVDDDRLGLSDRQARAVIIAAERLAFEREPDLYDCWYDQSLHDDALEAADYLRARDRDALREALVAEETLPADHAAGRITESGRFTLADRPRHPRDSRARLHATVHRSSAAALADDLGARASGGGLHVGAAPLALGRAARRPRPARAATAGSQAHRPV